MKTSVIAFTKVSFPWGWMGNMAPFPVVYGGQTYRTSEALFQCLRFRGHPFIQEAIRREKSPMGAKMRAKTYRNRLEDPICDARDLKRMEVCLRLKCKNHPQLKTELLKTGRATLIEDCSNRRYDIEIDGRNHAGGLPFWGARYEEITKKWCGQNALGDLWMRLRKEFQAAVPTQFNTPPTFIGHCYFQPIMSTAIKRATEQAEERLKQLQKLGETQVKVVELLNKAGYKTLEAFNEALAEVAGKPKPAKAARADKPASSGKKIKRSRVTEEQVKQMAALHEKETPVAEICDKVKVTPPTFYRYKDKGFKFQNK